MGSGIHYKYNYCYLVYMAIRLIEMQRILKDTGSIYLHCDSTMSHYIKLLMDIIFGTKNFRNEIVWYYHTSGNTKKYFVKNNDVIFFYSKTLNYYFNLLKEKRYTISKSRKEGKHNLGHAIKEFFKDENGIYQYVNMDNVFEIPYINSQAKERTGYPTQKPLALLERIIKASSKEGDIVLDPFCGCATTCIASEKLNRKWIGIDISHKAYDLVRERLKKEIANPEDLTQYQIKVDFQTTPPKRTDKGTGDDLIKKYVYVISHPNYINDNRYKVGIASDTKLRLNSYQTSDPDRAFKLEHKKLTPYFRETEGHIHRKFKYSHEWVKGNLEDIIKEIEDFNVD